MHAVAQPCASAAEPLATAEFRALLRLAADLAPPLLLFVGLERALMPLCRLPEIRYSEPVIALGLARALAEQPLLPALAALLVGLRGRMLCRSWAELEHGRALQCLISAIALAFAWAFSSYDVNLYFDREHLADRALLAALAALVAFRPGFLLLYLPLLLAIIWQFDFPFGGYSWTDKSAPLRVLLFFAASFVWLACSGGRRAQAFVFGAGCLLAAHYWIPGFEKLRLGWLAHGQLHHLTLAAWENGWLAQLDSAQIIAFVAALARFEPLSQAMTLALEAGALLFFARAEIALGLLAGWILLHAGIFATSGICFWKWALADAGLFALLLALRRSPRLPIFGPLPCALSLILIALAPHWCEPVRLGWYDTRLAYTYRYQAVDAQGRSSQLAPSFFAPYDLSFAQGRFHYLSQQPALVATYGATRDPKVAAALLRARSLAEIEHLEAELGQRASDPAQAARFDRFMLRFLAASNRRLGQHHWFAAVAAPLHIWTSARAPAYAGEQPIARLRVERVTTLWDGAALRELRVERVRELVIPREASLAAGDDIARRQGIRANRAVAEIDQRLQREAREERREADQVVAEIPAAREAQQRHQQRLQGAVAPLDPAARESAQQMAQAVFREAVVVLRSLVDLEHEGRAQHEVALRHQHAAELRDRALGRGDVLEHFEQEDRIETRVRETAQVADVGHQIGAALRGQVDVQDPALSQPGDAPREQAARADVQHALRTGQRLEGQDLALEERVQVLAAEAIRAVDHERACAEAPHLDGQAPAHAFSQRALPHRRRNVAPRSA